MKHSSPSLLALSTFFVVALFAGCTPGAGSGPSTWIDRPLDGDQVPIEPLTIQAHASDVDGVARLEFFVGDASLSAVPTDGSRFVDAKAGWSPTAPGSYIIHVNAVDSLGNRGDSATVRIVVTGLKASETPTATPTAVIASPQPITETPTSVPAGVITNTSTPVPAAVITDTPTPAPAIVITDTPTLTPSPMSTPTMTPTSAPVCPGAPGIEYFTADAGTITFGQSTTLRWGAVTNATSAEINPDIGGVPSPGAVSVSPGQTTTYMLTAIGCGGTTSKQVKIVVKTAPSPTPTPDTSPPTISNLSANPTKIWVVSSNCASNPQSTTVNARVTDPSGVQSVIARWYFNGARNETAMSQVGGNNYQASIGGFNSSGSLSIYVVATDTKNNVGQVGPVTVAVAPCIQ